MKRMRLVIFLLVALVQVSVPASVIWKRSQTLKHGRVWKFKTAPVDPVDFTRGRYIALSFEIERFPMKDAVIPDPSLPVFVVLKEDDKGFAAIDRVTNEPMSGDNVFVSESNGLRDDIEQLYFPFRKYWVTEAIAPEAERAYANNSTRKNPTAYVTVRIRNGDVALEQLYIENQPLVDYLRSQRAAGK